MWLLIALGVGCIVAFALCRIISEWSDLHLPLFLVGGCFGMGLLLFLLFLPIQKYQINGEIAEFNSVQQTLECARGRGNDLENAALQQKVIESNKWLANLQYYETTIWGLWIPDKINELKPIK